MKRKVLKELARLSKELATDRPYIESLGHQEANRWIELARIALNKAHDLIEREVV